MLKSRIHTSSKSEAVIFKTIPDTLDEILLPLDECQNLQKLLKEHCQTSHLHYARIYVGRGNINLLKYPVKCSGQNRDNKAPVCFKCGEHGHVGYQPPKKNNLQVGIAQGKEAAEQESDLAGNSLDFGTKKHKSPTNNSYLYLDHKESGNKVKRSINEYADHEPSA
ncbi:unnamed protein product [Dovyalis caffra]|uniref:Uncharacterized protein n=1 Tax=Dovyalis caffra TaxID=77055 RepID=A0AAV1SLI1_9ROSI|nr:unnamed protein product [Dovyalis caffra]